jgi:hypothetical protein
MQVVPARDACKKPAEDCVPKAAFRSFPQAIRCFPDKARCGLRRFARNDE